MNKKLLLSISLNIAFTLVVIGALIFLFIGGYIPGFDDRSRIAVAELPKVSELSQNQDELEFSVEIVAENLEIPWSLAHIDEDTKLVTERPGRIRLIENKNVSEEPVYEIPNVVAEGESGLMSMALHPQFSENNFVYIYYSYSKDNGETALRVSRFVYDDERFVNEEIIVEDIPYGRFHAGGEIAFGPEGKLYITTGDVTDRALAQDVRSLAGKTLRVNDDGTIPNDNPFVDYPEIRPEIFTVGHRNAQGIDWHPETEQQYQSEHGPSGFDGGRDQDEINLIIRGRNYGWPIIRGEEEMEDLETPIKQYTPAIAPSSILFYEGEMFTELQGKLLVAALRGENILVLEIENGMFIQDYRMFDGEYGRIRDLSVGMDGSIYFTTSNTDGRGEERENDDKVYRIYR